VPFFGQQPDRYQDLAQKGSGTVQNAQQYTSQLRQQEAAVQKRGQGFALFGIAVVVAPVVCPILGGWLSVGFAVMAAVAFLLMIPWELSRRDPMIDIGMVTTRQFGACFAVSQIPFLSVMSA
jgi:hypothetical protein